MHRDLTLRDDGRQTRSADWHRHPRLGRTYTSSALFRPMPVQRTHTTARRRIQLAAIAKSLTPRC
ncbi:hypothetical protein C8Q77DRAFT_1141757 [Trametes polyzona]|nr:hypothetical protein C8Q77DRAFT_1141757 [Trametes polyzona]